MESLKLANEIADLYPSFKEKEQIVDACRTVLKEKAEKLDPDNPERKEFKIDDLILRFKAVKKRDWYNEKDLKEELLSVGALPLAVSIKNLTSFDLSSFQIEGDVSLRFYPKRLSKALLEEKKKNEAIFIEELRLKSIEEIISIFRLHKMQMILLEKKVEGKRSRLLDCLLKEDMDSLSTDFGSFKIAKGNPQYDIGKIFSSKVKRSFLFACKKDAFGEIHCVNLSTKDEFHFVDGIFCGTYILNFRDEQLFMDDEPLKKLSEPIEIDGEPYLQFEAQFEVDGSEVLLECPLSFTKVDELIERRIISKKFVREHQIVREVSLHFEAIEEHDDIARKLHFQQMQTARSQAI